MQDSIHIHHTFFMRRTKKCLQGVQSAESASPEAGPIASLAMSPAQGFSAQGAGTEVGTCTIAAAWCRCRGSTKPLVGWSVLSFVVLFYSGPIFF